MWQTAKTLEMRSGLDLEGLGMRSVGDPEAPTGLLGGIQGSSEREQLPNAVCPPGREVSPAHQYAMAGAVSFPFFWLAGAGSAVFWVLGKYRVWVVGVGSGDQEREQGPELSIFLQEPPLWSLAPTPPSTRSRPWTGKSCRWSQCEGSASLRSQLPIPVPARTALPLQPAAPSHHKPRGPALEIKLW